MKGWVGDVGLSRGCVRELGEADWGSLCRCEGEGGRWLTWLGSVAGSAL